MTYEGESPAAYFAPQPPPRRPGVVVAAYVLWICTGVFQVLGGVSIFANPQQIETMPVVQFGLTLYFVGVGVAGLVYAGRLRRGLAGSRNALTIIGALGVLTCWPIPLIIAAFILQSRRSVGEWLVAVNPGHPNARPGPGPRPEPPGS